MIRSTLPDITHNLTLMQTSIVLLTQLEGTPLEPKEEMPLTFLVVVPPLLSTLHARPDLWSGSPSRMTPRTASNEAPVSCESAATVAAAP